MFEPKYLLTEYSLLQTCFEGRNGVVWLKVQYCSVITTIMLETNLSKTKWLSATRFFSHAFKSAGCGSDESEWALLDSSTYPRG